MQKNTKVLRKTNAIKQPIKIVINKLKFFEERMIRSIYLKAMTQSKIEKTQ